MRKIFGITAIFAVCLGMLSACENASGEITETISEASVTSSETVSEVSEITETEMSETETTAEIPENAEQQDTPQYVDMSGYTGNFYEWKYDYDIVTYGRENFAGGEDIISAAAKVIRENVTYDINGEIYTYDEMISFAKTAEKSEEYDRYLFDIGGETFRITVNIYELYSGEDGSFDPFLEEGVYEDFDGDGKKESFLSFGLINPNGLFNDCIFYTVFVDSEGNAELLPEAEGLIFDYGGMLNPIRYNGFTHMCIMFGVNNSTRHAEYYAMENGRAVHKHNEFSLARDNNGAFMVVSAAQEMGKRLIFWNEEIGEYCTLAMEDITDEDAEELWSSEAFQSTKYAEEYESAENVKRAVQIVGGKYYGMYGLGFERVDGKFIRSEFAPSSAVCVRAEVLAAGVDIDKANAEMVRLEN